MPPKATRKIPVARVAQVDKAHRTLHGHLKTPTKQAALNSAYADFEQAVVGGIEPLVPQPVRMKEHLDKFGDKYNWDQEDNPPAVEELMKDGDPIVAFEPQLHRINRVLHYWLEQCHRARFEKPEEKFRSIAGMAKALHENMRVVLDVVRLLHEIYDTRTFNRLVLDAIKDIAPDIRLKIVQKLQVARQELREFKALQGAIDVQETEAGPGHLA
jgi:hypothetical protein